jgi:hypothetical protein
MHEIDAVRSDPDGNQRPGTQHLCRKRATRRNDAEEHCKVPDRVAYVYQIALDEYRKNQDDRRWYPSNSRKGMIAYRHIGSDDPKHKTRKSPEVRFPEGTPKRRQIKRIKRETKGQEDVLRANVEDDEERAHKIPARLDSERPKRRVMDRTADRGYRGEKCKIIEKLVRNRARIMHAPRRDRRITERRESESAEE